MSPIDYAFVLAGCVAVVVFLALLVATAVDVVRDEQDRFRLVELRVDAIPANQLVTLVLAADVLPTIRSAEAALTLDGDPVTLTPARWGAHLTRPFRWVFDWQAQNVTGNPKTAEVRIVVHFFGRRSKKVQEVVQVRPG